jgi:putative DNA primase/helicase
MCSQLSTLISATHAKRSGSSWMARCPAHDDNTPSLAIRESDTGKLLLHCHAGCTQHEVITALRERGLWESTAEYQRGESRIVAQYNYTDADGSLIYQVVRFHPKRFLQRYPFKHGQWIWKKHPHQTLYRLSEVLRSTVVFLVEGERDADTLRSWGFVATTNAGGASAPWLPDYTAALRGREVIVIPDADPLGRERAKRISRALLGHAAQIAVWEPDGVKYISDWFAAGHSELELIEMITGAGISQ